MDKFALTWSRSRIRYKFRSEIARAVADFPDYVAYHLFIIVQPTGWCGPPCNYYLSTLHKRVWAKKNTSRSCSCLQIFVFVEKRVAMNSQLFQCEHNKKKRRGAQRRPRVVRKGVVCRCRSVFHNICMQALSFI